MASVGSFMLISFESVRAGGQLEHSLSAVAIAPIGRHGLPIQMLPH